MEFAKTTACLPGLAEAVTATLTDVLWTDRWVAPPKNGWSEKYLLRALAKGDVLYRLPWYRLDSAPNRGNWFISRGVNPSRHRSLNFSVVALTVHFFTPKPMAMMLPVLRGQSARRLRRHMPNVEHLLGADHQVKEQLDGQAGPEDLLDLLQHL